MKKELSNCCKAKLITNYEEEGTNYYHCLKCGRPCDIYTEPNMKSQKTDKWEEKYKGKTKRVWYSLGVKDGRKQILQEIKKKSANMKWKGEI